MSRKKDSDYDSERVRREMAGRLNFYEITETCRMSNGVLSNCPPSKPNCKAMAKALKRYPI